MFRFVYLRGHFQKQLRKVEKTPSGSGGTVTPKWEYFEACTFLTPVYSKVQLVDNVQPQPDLAEVIYEGTLEDLMDASGKEDKPFIGHILSSSLAITPAASQNFFTQKHNKKDSPRSFARGRADNYMCTLSNSDSPSNSQLKFMRGFQYSHQAISTCNTHMDSQTPTQNRKNQRRNDSRNIIRDIKMCPKHDECPRETSRRGGSRHCSTIIDVLHEICS
ncbi:hypothetical protein GWK47_046073 [Chionoecetes opilio]|uniref:Uncharacterized protein n=1 Tax=Chionoecetes opilio TaxID=41210 RepID=A0A8J4YHZ1_CHIOP|nr:hypothetical protein GWK47_046073 [Chionoecetes opilio]